MSAAFWFVLAALVVGIGLLALGFVRPLTARLGMRNAWRHRRQTVTVILGLLAGTAVVGASLATGDSLEAGLTDAALTVLDELDVVIHIPGNLYFSESLADELVAAPLAGPVAGTSRVVVESSAVEHPGEDLYEPTAVVIGFDPEEDRPFGPFWDAVTDEAVFGEELGPGEVYVNARLAGKLDAEAGDRIQMRYRTPLQPLVPELTWFNGTLVSASGAPNPATGDWVYAHGPQDVYSTTVEVPDDAERVLAVVVWPDPSNTTDLDPELVAPDGTTFQATNGSAGPASPAPVPAPVPGVPLPPGFPVGGTPGAGPENPSFLVVERDDIVPGTWTFNVHAKAAADQPFVSFVAVLVPEYDLASALSAYEDLEDTFGDGFADELAPDLDARNVGELRNVTVARVVAMEGKAVFFDSDAIFMSRSAAQEMYGVEGRVNWLKVTNVGDARGGLAGTNEVVRFFEDRIDAVGAARAEDPSGPTANLAVEPLKQRFLQQTEEAASGFTQFLTLIGSFTLIAGIMLIVNIFSMLAEERRHELGIARAVGLTRRDLVLAFTFEGSLYTLAASALGVVAGLGLSLFLVWGINSLAPPDVLFRIPFRPEPASLALAFAIGSLITFATVAAASYRASRLNIVRAIRDLDDPDVRTKRGDFWRIVLFAALVGATVLGILLGSFLALAVLPAVTLFALGPVLGRYMRRDRAWILVSTAAIAYTLFSYFLQENQGSLEGEVAVVLRGVVLVVAGTVALVHVDALPRAVAWLLSRDRRLAAIARVATTYPLHRRFRTGLTLSMYALVIMVIVLFSTFFTMFVPDITQQTGDYHIVGDSQVPAQDLMAVEGVAALRGTPEDPFLGVARVDTLVEHFEFGDQRILINGEIPQSFDGDNALFYGFDADFADHNGFRLDEWDAAYGDTEREVWQAAAADPSLVLVSFSVVGNLSEPDGKRYHSGDVLTVNTTGGQTDYTIAGIMEQGYFGGVWMHEDEVGRLFAELDGMYLFRLEPGTDPAEAAKRIERAFRPIGMDADDIEADAAEFTEQTTRIFQLFQAYLALGLVVGVASIGIVTSRAVLERRREIGMLKAIGFTKRMVGAAFLAEVLFVLATASFIGTVMGLAIARAVFESQFAVFPGVSFEIPWWHIVQMLAVALVATVLATVVPVIRASRVPAAEALRTIE